MKKLILILICLFVAPVFGWPMKPMLGRLPYWPAFEQPVGLWLMNEGSGSRVNDLSGNRNTGTLVADTHWVSCKFGSALSFDGTGDYVGLGDLTSLFNTEASLVMWLKLNTDPPATSAKSGLVQFDDAGAGQATHYPYTTGALYISTFHTGRVISAYDNSGFDKTKLHQLVITTKPGANNYILYQNGRKVTDGTGPATVTLSSTSFIGRNFPDDYKYFNGLISQVTLFNHALSAQQIAYLYRNPWPWFAPRNQWWGGTITVGAVGQFIFINMN